MSIPLDIGGISTWNGWWNSPVGGGVLIKHYREGRRSQCILMCWHKVIWSDSKLLTRIRFPIGSARIKKIYAIADSSGRLLTDLAIGILDRSVLHSGYDLVSKTGPALISNQKRVLLPVSAKVANGGVSWSSPRLIDGDSGSALVQETGDIIKVHGQSRRKLNLAGIAVSPLGAVATERWAETIKGIISRDIKRSSW